MGKKHILLAAVMMMWLSVTALMGQGYQFKWGEWKHESLTGTIGLEGLFRSQETILKSNLSESPKVSLFNAKFALNSKSYIWHPNFWKLNMNVEYTPSARRDNYIVIPDQSESQTAERFYLQSTFFIKKPLTFNFHTNLFHNFTNRDLLTNTESYKKDFGVSLAYRNGFLPFTLAWRTENWDQNELQTGRTYITKRQNLISEVEQTFTGSDRNKITYTYDDFNREYPSNSNVRNFVNSLNFSSQWYFGKKREHSLSSLFLLHDQKGDNVFTQIQVTENYQAKLPYNLKLVSGFNFTNYEQPGFTTKQTRASSRLQHQLFESLTSNIFYEYTKRSQIEYDETINLGSFGFQYTKSIPAEGRLTLSYEFRRYDNDRAGDQSELRIVNEEHNLTDGTTELLENPRIDIASIVVSNANKTIIYQENLDYLLIRRGEFIEIQRLPGGQIANGDPVSVDYIAMRSNTSAYVSINNAFAVNLSFINNLFEVYYRSFSQDYSDIKGEDPDVLKSIAQDVYGTRIRYHFVTAGIEQDNYASNIIPYKSMRYYLQLNGQVAPKLNLMLTGSQRRLDLTSAKEIQKFSDVSSRLSYDLWYRTRILLETGYRFQNGRGIDLNLRTMRTGFVTQYRKLNISVGYELFRRDFSGERVNYNGGYVRLERNF